MEGLFKVEYEMDGRAGHSVMHVHAGSMIGGNTAFALIGWCQHRDGEIAAEIDTQRHHPSRTYPNLLEAAEVSIRMRGRLQGQVYRFTGDVRQEPGKVFRALMTPFNDDEIPPPGRVGESGIVNGLYSLEMRMPEGKARVDTGVMLLYDGEFSAAMASSTMWASTVPRTAVGKASSSIRSIPRQNSRVQCSAAARSGSVFRPL